MSSSCKLQLLLGAVFIFLVVPTAWSLVEDPTGEAILLEVFCFETVESDAREFLDSELMNFGGLP